ncbi:LptM family lipoprotein [Clostridium sulfidigenes]|uniref:LptM family lipoprotein n=1 Tax=Clostridium sulfidigenes TaxID=318464 RepID=UPI003F8947D7
MKRIIALVLTATIGLALVGCGTKTNTSEDSSAKTTEQASTEDSKEKESTEVPEVTYESFESLLNSFANKEYYYNEANTLKLLTDEDEAAYVKKAEAALDKVLTDEKIDKSKAKIYQYYRNVNGKKDQVAYVITYGDNNTAEKIYEVYSDVSDDFEITFKEVKENSDIIAHKQFAELFKGEF